MTSYKVHGSKFEKTGFVRWSQALAFLVDKAQRENCSLEHPAKEDAFCGTWAVLFTDAGNAAPTRIYTIVEVHA